MPRRGCGLNEYCKDCEYVWRAGVGRQLFWACTYILHTGRRRPCPAGDGCTEHSKHGGGVGVKIDLDLAKQLWAEGKTDAQVAKEVGASVATLRTYKRRLGLTVPRVKKTSKTAEFEQLPAENAVDPSKPTIIAPPPLWKIGLSICIS